MRPKAALDVGPAARYGLDFKFRREDSWRRRRLRAIAHMIKSRRPGSPFSNVALSDRDTEANRRNDPEALAHAHAPAVPGKYRIMTSSNLP